jgi:hypothetical protein
VIKENDWYLFPRQIADQAQAMKMSAEYDDACRLCIQ